MNVQCKRSCFRSYLVVVWPLIGIFYFLVNPLITLLLCSKTFGISNARYPYHMQFELFSASSSILRALRALRAKPRLVLNALRALPPEINIIKKHALRSPQRSGDLPIHSHNGLHCLPPATVAHDNSCPAGFGTKWKRRYPSKPGSLPLH